MTNFMLGLFAFFATNLAQAAGPTLFNVELGRGIDSYPSCYAPEGEGKICVHPQSGGTASGGDHYVYIELRPGRPAYLKTNISATIHEEKIIELMVTTNGLKYQDEILGQLTAHFGKPSHAGTEEVQNRFGARFLVKSASWSLRSARANVTFVGATETIDEGYVGLKFD